MAQPPPPPPQPQPPPPQQPPPPLPQPQATSSQQPTGPPAVQPQAQAQPPAQPTQPPPKAPPAITTVGSAAVLVRRRPGWWYWCRAVCSSAPALRVPQTFLPGQAEKASLSLKGPWPHPALPALLSMGFTQQGPGSWRPFLVEGPGNTGLGFGEANCKEVTPSHLTCRAVTVSVDSPPLPRPTCPQHVPAL